MGEALKFLPLHEDRYLANNAVVYKLTPPTQDSKNIVFEARGVPGLQNLVLKMLIPVNGEQPYVIPLRSAPKVHP